MTTAIITFPYLSHHVKERFPKRLRQGTRGGSLYGSSYQFARSWMQRRGMASRKCPEVGKVPYLAVRL